jgi:hypothetical protein
MPESYIVTTDLSCERIADQVITFVEGGGTYWCRDFILESSDHTPVEKPWYSDPKLYDQTFLIRVRPHDDKKVYQLTPNEIRKGLKVLGEKYPSRVAEILEENGDAETADLFIQCCVFGEVVYG